ncbi:MAG: hypothetical protein AAGD35_05815 [Actinomycetota bacterium]
MTVTSPRVEPTNDRQWLRSLLGSDTSGSPVTYLARPSATEPRLLVPLRPRKVAAASMRRLNGGRAPSEAAAIGGARILARLGLLRFAPGEVLTEPAFALVRHLASLLGEPGLTASITIGPPRRNRKPVLQLLRPDGRVVGFAKVGWSDLTRDLVRNEAEVLRSAGGRFPHRVEAPGLVLVEEWRDLVVTVCSELRPPNGLPAGAPEAAEVVRLVSLIDRERRSFHRLPMLDEPALGPAAAAIDVPALSERHETVELTTALWHGDLTPWNMVRRSGRTYLWDWEFAGPHRPVGFDLLHHRFEALRRSPRTADYTPSDPFAPTMRLLEQVIAEAGDLLELVGVNDTPEQREAVIDAYLCELIVREDRLHGQLWDGGEMALLGPAATAVLKRRIAG